MRFSAHLPTDRVGDVALLGAPLLGALARGLEDAGFDACYATEHPFPPDAWLASGGHHALDPFVALTAAAAATERLLLHTHVIVLGYRNPFLLAKAAASLDVASGGRVRLGVAAGYLEPEFRVLGGDFAGRNERADEALVAMKQAWSGTSVKRAGAGFEADGHSMLPAPIQRPHPPIWMGGNSRRALRRAAEHAQGWSPFPQRAAMRGTTRTPALESIADLAPRIEELHAAAARFGRREPLDVVFAPFGARMGRPPAPDPDAFCEQVQKLAAIGVSWITIGLPATSRAEYLEHAARFGEQVIARLKTG